MKTVYSLLFLTILGTACDKPIESEHQIVDLNIVQTTTPKTATQNGGIVSNIKVMGTDLCYNFAYFTVDKQQFIANIHAIGTYPNRPTACPQALYYKDTTLTLPTTTSGQYVLRFYNASQLFKSDTVQVN